MLCVFLALVTLVAAACGGSEVREGDEDDRLRVVATTSMLADLVREVGGDAVQTTGLMGPGIDPHLYQASEGDVGAMAGADLVVYNGLHLEGKMTDLFERMDAQGTPTLPLAERAIDPPAPDPDGRPPAAGPGQGVRHRGLPFDGCTCGKRYARQMTAKRYQRGYSVMNCGAVAAARRRPGSGRLARAA